MNFKFKAIKIIIKIVKLEFGIARATRGARAPFPILSFFFLNKEFPFVSWRLTVERSGFTEILLFDSNLLLLSEVS